MILGITGAGGAGKSTLTDHLIARFREQGKTVGDCGGSEQSFLGWGILRGSHPASKPFSGRWRLYSQHGLQGLSWWLSRATYDVIRIMEAMGKEVVIVETLGAGQDEIDVIHIAHTCLLVAYTGNG